MKRLVQSYIVFTMLLGLPSSVVMAAPKKKTKKKPSFTEEITTSYNEEEKLLFGVAADAGFIYIGAGFGAEAWFAASPSWHFGLQYLAAKGINTAKEHKGSGIEETFDANLGLINPYARFFLTESLTLNSSIGFATIKGKYGYEATSDATETTMVNLSSTATIMQLAIGNHWVFNTGHAIGIDWLGLGYVLNQKTTFSADEDATLDALEARVSFFEGTTTEKRFEKNLKQQLQIYGLVFRFGYRF